jgi:hypothetical protein
MRVLATAAVTPCVFTENFVYKTPHKYLLRESKQFDLSDFFEEVYDLRMLND